MATEKILNTRVALKIDTLANWNKSTIGLKKGELAIATVAATAGTGLVEPVAMIKIGEDGVKTFSQLEWNLYAKASDVLAACKSEEGLTAFVNNVIANAGIATDEAMGKLAERVQKLEGDADTEGSVAKAIKDAIDALDLANTYVAKETGKGLSTNDLTDALKQNYDAAYNHSQQAHAPANAQENVIEEIKVNGTKVDPTGKSVDITVPTGALADKDEVAKEDLTEALANEIDGKVASVAAGDASVTIGGTATAPTVAAKLSGDADNALTLAEDGLKVVIPAAPEYTVVKAEDSGEYAAVYNLTKNGEIVGASINIPKDIVVKSGSVVGDELVLVLNNKAATEIRIPVGSLIEYVTSGSQATDMVVINVDETTHKVTAIITDGTVTLDKLDVDTQTKINKAHEHANKTLLDSYDQTNDNIKDAVAKKHAHANGTVLDGITAGQVEAWDKAVQTVEAAAGSGLKATADGTKVTIDFDSDVVFVFDCGDAGVTA